MTTQIGEAAALQELLAAYEPGIEISLEELETAWLLTSTFDRFDLRLAISELAIRECIPPTYDTEARVVAVRRLQKPKQRGLG